MALNTVQDASAVTDLVLTGLKMAGYGVFTVGSVLGSDYYLRGHLDKEKRMQRIICHWSKVLKNLNAAQRRQIGENAVRDMITVLKQLDSHLSILAIRLRKSSLWSRTMGKDADDIRKLERLVEQTDDDLRVRTKDTLNSVEFDLDSIRPKQNSATTTAEDEPDEPDEPDARVKSQAPMVIFYDQGDQVALPLRAVLAPERPLPAAQPTVVFAQPVPEDFYQHYRYGEEQV